MCAATHDAWLGGADEGLKTQGDSRLKTQGLCCCPTMTHPTNVQGSIFTYTHTHSRLHFLGLERLDILIPYPHNFARINM